MNGPIGIFDSGYGGLTILSAIRRELPQYDYLYLGDNARTPYGTRSFDTVYKYTREAVRYLFDQGCSLVILACNTASAKALRNIQQLDLPQLAPDKRVLGVIRPTTEIIGDKTTSRQVGILGTTGTVASASYPVEINKFFPDVKVFQQACPMWVPLVENNEIENDGTEYFVKKSLNELLQQSDNIDTILLACTHYPLLLNTICKLTPSGISIITQGEIVAASLANYLQRHPEMEEKCSKNGNVSFQTTDDKDKFDQASAIFLGDHIQSEQVKI